MCPVSGRYKHEWGGNKLGIRVWEREEGVKEIDKKGKGFWGGAQKKGFGGGGGGWGDNASHLDRKGKNRLCLSRS